MMQTDTKSGVFRVLAGANLTGKYGYLVKMTHDTGVPVVVLPSAISDLALYLVDDENTDGELVSVEPLSGDRNVRVCLKGTCNPGDVLVLADPGTAADAGKVRALPAGAGTYRGLAVAEEKGVDGQFVLCRPYAIGNIVVNG